jgi:hypothetical protein
MCFQPWQLVVGRYFLSCKAGLSVTPCFVRFVAVRFQEWVSASWICDAQSGCGAKGQSARGRQNLTRMPQAAMLHKRERRL